MKKSTMIIIALIYISSIVVVSIFGLKAVVYEQIVPVTHIQCVNETKGNVQVEEGNKKIIRVAFTTPGDIESLTGTILQLEFRVLPDNATNKELKYVYARENYPQVKFHQIEGRETGAIVFTAPALFTLRVYSTDGSNIYDEMLISVR